MRELSWFVLVIIFVLVVEVFGLLNLILESTSDLSTKLVGHSLTLNMCCKVLVGTLD